MRRRDRRLGRQWRARHRGLRGRHRSADEAPREIDPRLQWSLSPAGGIGMISDLIEFELFKNALFGIADEMALTVFRTTYSGVLKDNMDYSTALLYGHGAVVSRCLTLH